MKAKDTDYEALQREVLEDFACKCMAIENGLRRELAKQIEIEMKKRNWRDYNLAKHAKCPLSEIRRLLHQEVGGRLTLRTIIRSLNVLGLKLKLEVV
jgi:hypothetical protein